MFVPLVSEAALAFLFGCALKLTVLFTCACVAAFSLRRNSSALRHHVWAAAIVASLVLPLLMLLLPAWHSTALSAASVLAPSQNGAPSAITSASPSVTDNAAKDSSGYVKSARALLLLWCLGFSLLFLRILIGLARLGSLYGRSKPLFEDVCLREVLDISNSLKLSRAVRLLESRNPLAMPLTYGFFYPIIILPAGASQWSDGRRHIVLSHELAHIAHNDWFLQICAEIARAFYWFHPLVWLAAARLRHESERACDDAVLLSGVQPAHYASQLLDLARTLENPGRTWSTALAIARPSNLERRFAAMLNSSIDRRRPARRTKVLILFLALALLAPLAALRLAAQRLSGKINGTIYDPSGAVVPNATIIMSNHAANTIDMTGSDREGNFAFKTLPAGRYELQVLKPGFKPYRASEISLDPSRDFSQTITLEMGTIKDEMRVVPEDATSVVSKDESGKPWRIHVGGNVQAPKIITKVVPIYPQSAKAAGVQGTVVLHAVIGKDGTPLSLQVMSSQIDPELARSALEAVSQWRYTPTLLNGEPIEIDTTIDIVYSLQP